MVVTKRGLRMFPTRNLRESISVAGIFRAKPADREMSVSLACLSALVSGAGRALWRGKYKISEAKCVLEYADG
jgi:hypothetical protein